MSLSNISSYPQPVTCKCDASPIPCFECVEGPADGVVIDFFKPRRTEWPLVEKTYVCTQCYDSGQIYILDETGSHVVSCGCVGGF